jgi:hypothetical protein
MLPDEVSCGCDIKGRPTYGMAFFVSAVSLVKKLYVLKG